MRFIEVARMTDLPDGVPRRYLLEGQAVLVLRRDGEVHALADTCTHEQSSLAEGFVQGGAVECARHGARFDLRSGAVLALPATRDLRVYPVRVDRDVVSVGIEDGTPEREAQAS